MNLSHFFIDRPIFAAVLSILIVLVGTLAYTQLPVALFPEVVPPTVVVRATYPGATAQIVADTVATPIEQEINGVENMLYMSSISTNDGQARITVTFKLGTDLDIAQVLTQNRVAIAEARLPEEARRLGITTQKESPDLLMVAFLYSEDGAYDQLYVSNYAILQMKDVLARVDGVGDVQLVGAREYSMRIWLDPERIQALGLTGPEVVEALRTQNVQVAAGQLAQPPVPTGQAFQLVVNTQGRFIDPEQFGNVIIKSGTTPGEGRVVRVKDIARVELGGRDYSTNSYFNGREAVAIVISQRPGSNAIATEEAIQATLEKLRSRFPTGLKCEVGYNPTEFVGESIAAVAGDRLRGRAAGGARRHRVPAELALGDHPAGRNSRVARSAPSPCSRRWASRSTISRCSAWCSRSASSWMTRSWSSRTSSGTWSWASRRATPRATR